VNFIDGTRITPGTDGCRCDLNGEVCEWPCWQRIGLTEIPCCKDCPPLQPVDPDAGEQR
jgi:hypothetical protein